MAISTPITNARQYYINGLGLIYSTATTFAVAAGKCSNSTNENDIVVGLPLNVAATQTGVEPVADGTGNVVVNIAANGAAGLDTGTIAADTFYAVYAIGDSYNINPGSAVISADLDSPLLPAGYDMSFCIGYIKTDGSSHILKFLQEGTGLNRWMYYDAPIATSITAGSSATYANVDCSAGLPTQNPTQALFYCTFTPTAAGNSLVLAPASSTATLGYASASGSVGAVANIAQLICPTGAPNSAAIKYKVTGSAVGISVQAYLHQMPTLVLN